MKITEILKQDLNSAEKKENKINPTQSNARIGLSEKQATTLREKHGSNTLVSKNSTKPIIILFSQFKDIMVLILLVCTVISMLMGDYSEAIAIGVIVCLNAILGFFQEYRTEKTLKSLKNMAAPTARVYRDNKLTKVTTDLLVPEDVILIKAGDKVPADAVLLSAVALSANEAILTGESVPVSKIMGNKNITDNSLNLENVIYMGTTITKGHAKAKIIATGMDTQMGKIAGMLGDIAEEPTPLQKRLASLGKYIAIACLLVCAIVSVTGVMRGENIFDMLIIGVSLAVAAVPEGLPAIVTIALALAVNRMVKKKALVRRLHAVETLGCADVICSDKTGTLTQNKMTVKKLFVDEKVIDISGDGYKPTGKFTANGESISLSASKCGTRLLEISAFCNNAEISVGSQKQKSDISVSGDPTEIALLVMAGKANISKAHLSSEYTIIDEIPFDSERKLMSVIVKNRSGQRYIFTKGACDVVIKNCKQIETNEQVIPMNSMQRTKLLSVNEKMAKNALRVLGFAYKEITSENHKITEQDLTFIGLCGMIDPVRPEAKKSVKTCLKAGIKTVMITGDHKETACAIAKEIGIYQPNDKILTGNDLNALSDSELTKIINSVSVFARVSPDHKLRIVRAFKRHGHTVAMTGDGVNDAPAIKEADIGVSMGITGTDVTKEAASIILLNDNFATLVTAVSEGRVIYSNIRKFIRYLLSCNIGEVLTMFLGMLMGMPVILLPIQILVINLVTDGLPAIALGVEPAEKDIMDRKPRQAGDSVFSDGLLGKIVFRGCLIGLTTLTVFTVLFRQTFDVDIARTGAFLALTLTQLLHVFECKSENKNIFTVPYTNNLKLLFASALSGLTVFSLIYIKPLQTIFSTVPLKNSQLSVVFLFVSLVPVLTAITGALFKDKQKTDYIKKEKNYVRTINESV